MNGEKGHHLSSLAIKAGRAHRPRPAIVRRWFGVATLVALSPALIGGLWGWMGAHPPRLLRPESENPGLWGVDFQEVTLHTADGLALAAWYTPSRNGAIILAGHGYANARLPEVHALLGRHDYGVLSWDFRAHGRSEGDTTTVGYYESWDVEAALDFSLAQPGTRWVGLWGGSMGGIAGLRAAVSRPEIRALVLDSVPTCLADCVIHNVPLGVMRPFYRLAAEHEAGVAMALVRPLDQVGQLDGRPLFIIQGTRDSMMDPNSAQQLYRAAGRPKQIWLVPGAEHVDAHRSHSEEYERRVIAFFDRAYAAELSAPISR